MREVNTGRGFEILLVEDNPGDVRLTQEALKDSGIIHRMSVAQDGMEALAFLHRQGRYAQAPRPDLILLDLNLPRKDGREVLAEVKSDPYLRRIPIVVLTSSQAPLDILKAYDLHANCYITKVLELDECLAMVRTIATFWLTVVKQPSEIV